MTLENTDYRRVISTIQGTTPGASQLVLMSLRPKQEIGMEVHPRTTQYIYIVKGIGVGVRGGWAAALGPGSMVEIPPGTPHNIVNESSTERLQLFTIYVPPEHKYSTIQKEKPKEH